MIPVRLTFSSIRFLTLLMSVVAILGCKLDDNTIQSKSDPTSAPVSSPDDTTPVPIPSITISNPSLSSTAAGPVIFTITYANANSISLDSSDIILNSTGDATATIAVSGTGSTSRTVSLNSISGNGSLSFNINADTATNNTGNALAKGPSETVTVSNALKIYRSVGPANTVTLQAGAGIDLTIVNSTATFSTPLPDSVGIGDIIQYDADNDGPNDGSSGDVNHDALAVIHGRTSSTVYTVKSIDGSTPTATAGGTDQDWDIFRAYTSLLNAETGTENTAFKDSLENFDTWTGGKDLSKATGSHEQWNITLYADEVDMVNEVMITGWETTAENYIKIFTPVGANEVGISQRHKGYFDSSEGYTLVQNDPAGNDHNIHVDEGFVRIEGLQIGHREFANTYTGAIYIVGDTQAAQEHHISNNIIRGIGNLTSTNLAGRTGVLVAYNNAPSNCTAKIWNNIIYGIYSSDQGLITASGVNTTAYVYNNTLSDTTNTLVSRNSANIIAKNNISQNSVNGFVGTFHADSTNNLSELPGDAPGNNAQNSSISKFMNANAKDFRLASVDTSSKGQGIDLSNDPTLAFNNDIAGASRSGSWDRGASTGKHIRPTHIYRSVGSNLNQYLDSGNNISLSITGSVATFSAPIATNIGIGDALQYDSDNNGSIDRIAFIHARTSSTIFTIKNSIGNEPTNTFAVDNDWKIFRAYQKLAHFTGDASGNNPGTENTNIDVTVQDFDDLSVLPYNLISKNQVLNIVTYGGPEVDNVYASPRAINWKTSPSHYINIFTPTKLSEVGFSQRHAGKWDDSKYQRNEGIGVRAPLHIRVTGLQFTLNGTGSTTSLRTEYDFYGTQSDIQFSANIIKGGTLSGSYNRGILASSGYTAIFNNIIYDINGALDYGIGIASSYRGISYVFNNTVSNSNYGYYTNGGNSHQFLVNNIGVNNTGYNFSGPFASSSDFNMSDLTAQAPNATFPTTIMTPTFVDAANKDFRLSLAGNTDASGNSMDPSTTEPYSFTGDISGNLKTGSLDIGASNLGQYPTSIYRSLGPGKTVAILEPATTEAIRIDNNHLYINMAVHGNMGVGDVVQYDSNDDGTIDAVAFVEKRISYNRYIVKNASGNGAISTTSSAEQQWGVYRAYTSIANAVGNPSGGTENVGINAAVVNFDTWSGGKNYATTNENWFFTLYADAAETVKLDMSTNWSYGTTTNFVQFYTPSEPHEVGVPQGHSGLWSSDVTEAFTFDYSATSDDYLIIRGHFKIKGVQVLARGGANNGTDIFSQRFLNDTDDIEIANNIITRTTGSGTNHAAFNLSEGNGYAGGLKPQIKIYNNIISNYDDTGNTAIQLGASNSGHGGGDYYVYNNTIYNCTNGIEITNQTENNTTLINNIVQNSVGTNTGYIGTFNANSDYNISDQSADDMPGSNSVVSSTVSFVDPATGYGDFHLQSGDIVAKDTGQDLSNDANLSYPYDIDGDARSNWSIGADE
ncbi:MAG: hypothetical protein HOO06_15780 [Bdellovibrionaceae bacterium]|jgi:hypothetical protein|nr:hypothetical protein [Pseudobdellovibrionaceae bacterium]